MMESLRRRRHRTTTDATYNRALAPHKSAANQTGLGPDPTARSAASRPRAGMGHGAPHKQVKAQEAQPSGRTPAASTGGRPHALTPRRDQTQRKRPLGARREGDCSRTSLNKLAARMAGDGSVDAPAKPAPICQPQRARMANKAMRREAPSLPRPLLREEARKRRTKPSKRQPQARRANDRQPSTRIGADQPHN